VFCVRDDGIALKPTAWLWINDVLGGEEKKDCSILAGNISNFGINIIQRFLRLFC
jgi:hypothetical protein